MSVTREMREPDAVSRRNFLKLGGGLGLSLSLSQLAGVVSPAFVRSALAAERPVAYAGWEDLYRQMWKWDNVAWGSHSNVCLPGGCSFRVYTKDGVVWREEQTANSAASNPNYPDYNPLGCQKGCGFHNVLYGKERVKYPLKRVGKRGEGKWKRISWDAALAEVADSIIDACESYGPETVIMDAPHAHMGSVGYAGSFRFNRLLGGVSTDTNLLTGDFFMGVFETLGKMHLGYTADNLHDAELIFITHANWSYTMPALYHFLTEARYNGIELVVMAPDFSPTAPQADIHVPVGVGTDAAFWLGCCNVMVTEKLYDAGFVKEQTDLALLVRTDTGRYLRAPDVTGSGREDQLYFFDTKTSRVVEAPRGTLAFDGDQALEGTYKVTLADGKEVQVTPAFELLKKQLQDYTPEKASKQCGVDAELIRELGRKVARKRTCSYIGYNSPKHYHGDLMERALLLAMALSGNWGKPGTGFNVWAFPGDALDSLVAQDRLMAQGGGSAEFGAIKKEVSERLRREDPTVTDEIVDIKFMEEVSRRTRLLPAAIFLNDHAGYDKIWNHRSWQDPAMKKNFGEYLQEAIDKGWWGDDLRQPPRGVDPQVSLQIAHNPLRRVRQGRTQYPQVYYPKLKMLWTIEPRMSSSAMFCDIVLPAALYYEKWDLSVSLLSNPRIAFMEKVVEPPGEAKDEWEIFSLLLNKIGERAKARKLVEYSDSRGEKRKYGDLHRLFTLDGGLATGKQVVAEMTAVNTAVGVFPKNYTVEQFRKDGQVPVQGMGMGHLKELMAGEYTPGKPFYCLGEHLTHKRVYPTYARRAQFYIDHPWFIEVGEALPVHKPVPKIGGDHPFMITGGHPRHSVHSVHLANDQFAQLHRGRPVVHINDKEAAKRGIEDGDDVVVFNDINEAVLMARTTPAVRPDQVVVYFWETYQYKGWKSLDDLLVGQPKALHFAGGYEQVGRWYISNGSPSPASDRGVRVDIRKA